MKLLLLLLLALAAVVWIRSPEPSRIRTAIRFAPCFALMGVVAVTLGWWDRRRMRSGARHASPSVAWLAKRAAVLAVGLALAWIVLPIAWPAWAHYLACAMAAGSAGLYVSHLPLRL